MEKFPQILKKEDRYYGLLQIEYNGFVFAIPFRSNLNHKYGFKTILSGKSWCGLDYSKSIVIKPSDLQDTQFKLRDNTEYEKVKNNLGKITLKFGQYIDMYILAVNTGEDLHNICKFSTLQYFHKELGISN